jgi:hypothetical protein
MMIYDFGYSNKIKIPVDKIKRFELFYNIDKEKEDIIYYTRSFIVQNNFYNIRPKEINNILGRKPEPYERDYLNEIMNIYIQIDKAVNYYRLKILIDDYCIFLKDLGVFFEENKDKRRFDTINNIREQIEKLKENYNKLPSSDITDEVFYGYAKDIFNNVLNICITHFSKSKIFLKSAPKQSNILNATTPYQLYQQEKITVEEPLI